MNSSKNTDNLILPNSHLESRGGSTEMYSFNDQQNKPKMEDSHFTERLENQNQSNHHTHQNDPHHYQQIQQNNQRMHLNLMSQRVQQNPRLLSNEDTVKSQMNPNYNNNNNFQPRGPGIPFAGQRPVQSASSVRYSDVQQTIRHPYNYPSGGIPFDQPLKQTMKIEPPKVPADRFQPNLQRFPSPENYKAQIPTDPLIQSSIHSSGSETRFPGVLNVTQPTIESINKSPTGSHRENILERVNTERALDLGKEKSLVLDREDVKIESDQFIKSNESKNFKLKSPENIPGTNTDTIKKIQKENKKSALKEDNTISGMVKKNIKFFEQNDTAKTPLKPKAIITERKEKTTEVFSDISKNCLNKNSFESGVDETPIVHPNLRSIFQVPRKVAKISCLKEKKRSRKFTQKQFSEETSNKKKHIYGKPLTQLLKPLHLYSYKHGPKQTQNITTNDSEKELLRYFENTKSWRKLHQNESKTNEHEAKDKVVHKPTTNGDIQTPKKAPSRLQTPSKTKQSASPVRTTLKSPGTPGTPVAKLLPKTPESPTPPTPLIKKVPMNKIQVGAVPSPNLKTIRSKVGSLANTTHKPGGGNIKIESHKIDVSKVQPKTEAKNDLYKPSGGDKKIQQVKLQWSAKSKVGSMENATYKPGGGDKKIESVKLDFKERAKSKVGSKDNVKHVPGGGNVKIENQKLEFKAQSKVGSLDNVKHKPGGGDIKIFDDKTYLRQVSGNSSEGRASGTQVLTSFKRLHRTSQLVFKNDKRTSELARKEINNNYKKNKSVIDLDVIKDLIKFSSDVNQELKTTVVELEQTSPGTYRLHLRPEMFEEIENSAKK